MAVELATAAAGVRRCWCGFGVRHVIDPAAQAETGIPRDGAAYAVDAAINHVVVIPGRDRPGALFGKINGLAAHLQGFTANDQAGDSDNAHGPDDQQGINGGLLQRPAATSAARRGTTAYVCTMGIGDYDETERRILAAGGQVALPKVALAGMAWQGYYRDSAGNTFGIHQPDPNAA